MEILKMLTKMNHHTISANQISEPAIYNWYDSQGTFGFTGKDLLLHVATNTRLEVPQQPMGLKTIQKLKLILSQVF
jgi:hypothetical protein